MNITREQAIDYYKERLGNRWKKWGLEIVAAADSAVASSSFDPAKGNQEGYLYTLLRNQMWKTMGKREKFCALPSTPEDVMPDPDLMLLMKADIVHHLGSDMYDTALDYYGHAESIRAIAEKQSMSVETVRWRIKKLENYFIKWRQEDV